MYNNSIFKKYKPNGYIFNINFFLNLKFYIKVINDMFIFNKYIFLFKLNFNKFFNNFLFIIKNLNFIIYNFLLKYKIINLLYLKVLNIKFYFNFYKKKKKMRTK